MGIQESIERIDEINRLIERLEDERDTLNASKELPVRIERDWSDDRYPYAVLNDEREILTKFSNKHAAYRDLVRESKKVFRAWMNRLINQPKEV